VRVVQVLELQHNQLAELPSSMDQLKKLRSAASPPPG
jgi:hypothetical protein